MSRNDADVRRMERMERREVRRVVRSSVISVDDGASMGGAGSFSIRRHKLEEKHAYLRFWRSARQPHRAL